MVVKLKRGALCISAPQILLLAVLRLRGYPHEETRKIFGVVSECGVFNGSVETSLVWISSK